jgi:hypothetical protein
VSSDVEGDYIQVDVSWIDGPHGQVLTAEGQAHRIAPGFSSSIRATMPGTAPDVLYDGRVLSSNYTDNTSTTELPLPVATTGLFCLGINQILGTGAAFYDDTRVKVTDVGPDGGPRTS